MDGPANILASFSGNEAAMADILDAPVQSQATKIFRLRWKITSSGNGEKIALVQEASVSLG